MRPSQTPEEHCREIERCNQRGGRMLSIVDLLDAGTLAQDVAAHCMAAIASGASFLVGARPGGAGKTTVMGALLNFVPPDCVIQAATGDWRTSFSRVCWVCHEIGPGPYFAYLWGRPLREWFATGASGAMLASNLHADTMEEIEDQVIRQNGVPREHLRRIGLILFLEVTASRHGYRRTVTELWESDGTRDHALLWSRDGGWHRPATISHARLTCASDLLAVLTASDARTIHDVRRAFLSAFPDGTA